MQNWIDKAVLIINEQYAPDQIILFGSCAKGTSTSQSDVDLLIIKDTELPRAYRGLEVVRFLERYPLKFDLLFYTHDEINSRASTAHSFMDSILKTGLTLYPTPGDDLFLVSGS
jgi:predicted nucleotidyltransferase